MPVNRYYTPSRGQYVSQFVPQDLPADLMLKGALARQGKADAMDQSMSTLAAEWSAKALPNHDAEYVKQHKAKLESFIDQARTEDLSSPEFQRKYVDFVTKFKNDEGIQKAESAYTHHEEAMKRYEDYLKEDYAKADEYWDEYTRSYDIYTAKGGQGFTGEVQLANNQISKGMNTQKEMEQFFDQVKGDSRESIKNLSGSELYYQVKSGGVSKDKLDGVAAKALHTVLTGPVGDQLGAKFDMLTIPKTDKDNKPITQAQYMRSLSPEERQAHEEKKYSYIKDELYGVGRSFRSSEYSTNMDTALNQQAGYNREDAAEQSVIMSGQLDDGMINNPVMTWEKQLKDLGTKNYNLDQQIEKVKSNPGLYADGTLEDLTAKKKQINTEANFIRKERDTKYNELSELKAKELYGVDANGNAKVPTVNAKDHLTTKSAKAIELVNSTPEVRAAAYTHGNDINKIRQIQLQTLRNSGEWNKLDKQTQKELHSYYDALSNLDKKKATLKETIDKQWNQDYYSGEKTRQIQNTGYVTVPQGNNSLAKQESQVINQSKVGYKYYNSRGELVSISDDKGSFLSDFKMTGLTQEEFKGEGRGRVGMMTLNSPILNDKGVITGYNKKEVPVVVTSQDKNRQMTESSYAHEYLKQASTLEKQAASYGNDPYKAQLRDAKLNEAALARRQGLTLVSPEMAKTFEKIGNSDTYTSGSFTIEKGSGTGSLMSIDKKVDGSYKVKISNPNGATLMEESFPDSKSAQEFAVSITVD